MRVVVVDCCGRDLGDAYRHYFGGDDRVVLHLSPVGSASEMLDRCGTADCLVHFFASAPLTREFLLRTRVKRIVMAGPAPASLDRALVRERGIELFEVVGLAATAVAEFTLGLVLCAARGIGAASAGLKEGHWRPSVGREMSALSLGIAGYGKVGRELARMCRPLAGSIRVWTPSPSAMPAAGTGLLASHSLDDLFADCDVVSLHLRLTPETRGLVTRERIARLRPGSIVINTARAALIQEGALLEALRSGHLASAALDVFDVEPPAHADELIALPGVTATPHMAWMTREAIFRFVEAAGIAVINDDFHGLRRVP